MPAMFSTRSTIWLIETSSLLPRLTGSTESPFAISVLHHIPDYVQFLASALPRLAPGGSLLCLQDPLLYERLPATRRYFERLSYLSWRIGQGNLAAGLATTLRRLRGAYDETKSADMVEYHVVRNGVDEEAILAALRPSFGDVRLVTYWSTQSTSGMRIGERLKWRNTFGVHATGYRAAG